MMQNNRRPEMTIKIIIKITPCEGDIRDWQLIYTSSCDVPAHYHSYCCQSS